jgi:Flp pilus assembly protein TadG
MRVCSPSISAESARQLSWRRSRSASVVLEALLGIPILILVLMAGVQFGVTMIVHQAVLTAVTEGSREAAKVPTTVGALDGNRILLAVQSVATEVLGVQGILLANVQIIVEDSDNPGAALNNGVRSSGPLIGPVPAVSGITDPAEVRVMMRLEVANTPIPNLLSAFGVNLITRSFDVCSISRRDGA